MSDVEKHAVDRNEKVVAAVHIHESEKYGLDAAYEAKCHMVNEALNAIGMGRYQWEMFMVAGFGWLADNLWLQAIALVLPSIEAEFNPEHSAMATLALYVGLILGATFLGASADVVGRKMAFNLTLLIAGVFGTAVGSAPNFVGFAAMAACIGLGLGGNLPVDGALFLEFLPANRQNLLTLLSLFWSVGQVIGSLIAWVFLANYSCSDDAEVCSRDDNWGWRYTLFTCGGLTLAMFVVRVFVFPIEESPKFYLSKGRDVAAIEVLQRISKRNGVECPITLEMLRQTTKDLGDTTSSDTEAGAFSRLELFRRSFKEMDLEHVKPLFATKSLAINTSILMCLWSFIGLGYPLFNSFLPLYLRDQNASTGDNSIDVAYRNYTIQAVCGIPGSIVAALLVELRGRWLGRRGAMAISTIFTGVFLFLFTTARSADAQLGFNCVVAFAQNMSYGVLYGYTPEAFPGPHRGTGDALCSGLNRIFGLIAPIVRSYGGENSPSVPVFVSGALFLGSGIMMFFLPIETSGRSAM